MRYIYTPLLSTVRFAIASYYLRERKKAKTREREKRKKSFLHIRRHTSRSSLLFLSSDKKRVMRFILWLKASRDITKKQIIDHKGNQNGVIRQKPFAFSRQLGARWSIFFHAHHEVTDLHYQVCVNREKENDIFRFSQEDVLNRIKY